MKQKTIFKLWIIATLWCWAVYVFIWLCMCFVDFQIYNPIQIFLDIPIKDSEYRGGILGGYIAVISCKWVAVFLMNIDQKTK